MKALRSVGGGLLTVLMLSAVILGSGLLTLPLALRPLTPLGRLLLRLVLAHDALSVRGAWWL